MTCNNKVVALYQGGRVAFDPFNANHRALFRKALVSDRGEYVSHFRIEQGFSSVKEMMLYKMAMAGARILDAQAWGQTRDQILQSFRK